MAMLIKASGKIKEIKPTLQQVNTAVEEFIKTYIKPVAEKKDYYFLPYSHFHSIYGGHFILKNKYNRAQQLYLVIDLSQDPIVRITPRVKDRKVLGDEFPWHLNLQNPAESLEKYIELYENKIYPEVREGKRRVEVLL